MTAHVGGSTELPHTGLLSVGAVDRYPMTGQPFGHGNYAFELALIDLEPERGVLDLRWIWGRRSRARNISDVLEYAPAAWYWLRTRPRITSRRNRARHFIHIGVGGSVEAGEELRNHRRQSSGGAAVRVST